MWLLEWQKLDMTGYEYDKICENTEQYTVMYIICHNLRNIICIYTCKQPIGFHRNRRQMPFTTRFITIMKIWNTFFLSHWKARHGLTDSEDNYYEPIIKQPKINSSQIVCWLLDICMLIIQCTCLICIQYQFSGDLQYWILTNCVEYLYSHFLQTHIYNTGSELDTGQMIDIMNTISNYPLALSLTITLYI